MATNLEFIKSVTISSTTVIDMNFVFSDEYDVYVLKWDFSVDTASGGNWNYLRFKDSGNTIDTGTNYDSAVLHPRTDGTFSEYKLPSTTSMQRMGIQDQLGGGTIFTIYNPFDSGSYTFVQCQNSGWDNVSPTRLFGAKGIGVHKVAQSNTGFRIFNNAVSSMSGTASLYGVK
jgi:hypothetical protein